MKNIIYFSFLFLINSCLLKQENNSNLEHQASNHMSGHNLETELENYIKQLEQENKGKLEYYVGTKFIKNDKNKILTSEIYGQNNITIRTGIVGTSVKHQEKKFEKEIDRINFIQSYEQKIMALGYKKLAAVNEPLLFFQFQATKTNTDDLFDEPDRYTNIMDSIIHNHHLGSFAASDFGAGFNLLYNIWDINIALPFILETLKKNDLENKTLIAKRIYKSEKDWDYEAIYPLGYIGKFDSH